MQMPTAHAQALARFVEHLAVAESFSVDTIRRYRTWTRRWLTFLGQHRTNWLAATREHAIAWKAHLMETGRWRGDAIRQALVTGRKLYDWALEQEWYAGRNPFHGLRAPHTYRTVKLAPTPEQIEAVLDQAWPSDFQSLRARAIWTLFYGAGLRRSELRMLDMADVDLDQRLVAVNHGKAGSNDAMPLLPYVAHCLSEYLQHARPLVCSRPDGPVFVGLHGRRIGLWAVGEDVRRAAAILSRRVTPHDLRRAAATHLLQGGADVRQVQLFLRHRRLDTTMWYLGESGEHMRKAIYQFHPLARRGAEGSDGQTTPSRAPAAKDANSPALGLSRQELAQVLQPLVADTLKQMLGKLAG